MVVPLAVPSVASTGCGSTAAPHPRAALLGDSDAEDTDADGDGIADRLDACPDRPEDCDGFEDDDGCPDLDNDQDRIVDTCDRCPDQAELYNGNEDEDGCPDMSCDGLEIRAERMVIRTTVSFPRNRAELSPEAARMLHSFGGELGGSGAIEQLACIGRAGRDERRAARLALQRAGVVCAALTGGGFAGIAGAYAVDESSASALLTEPPDFLPGAEWIIAALPQPSPPPAHPERSVFLVVLKQRGADPQARWNGHTIEWSPRVDPPPRPPSPPPLCPLGTHPPAPEPPPAGGCPRSAAELSRGRRRP